MNQVTETFIGYNSDRGEGSLTDSHNFPQEVICVAPP